MRKILKRCGSVFISVFMLVVLCFPVFAADTLNYDLYDMEYDGNWPFGYVMYGENKYRWTTDFSLALSTAYYSAATYQNPFEFEIKSSSISFSPDCTYTFDFWIEFQQRDYVYLPNTISCTFGGQSFTSSTASYPSGTPRTHYDFSITVSGYTGIFDMNIKVPFKKEMTDSGYLDLLPIVSRQVNITVLNGVDQVLDEDFGYSKPNTPDQDEGLEAGNDLLDTMTSAVDDFNANVNSNTQVLVDNITEIKDVIDGAFDAIPLPITLTVSGVVVFFVIRKVVGR